MPPPPGLASPKGNVKLKRSVLAALKPSAGVMAVCESCQAVIVSPSFAEFRTTVYGQRIAARTCYAEVGGVRRLEAAYGRIKQRCVLGDRENQLCDLEMTAEDDENMPERSSRQNMKRGVAVWHNRPVAVTRCGMGIDEMPLLALDSRSAQDGDAESSYITFRDHGELQGAISTTPTHGVMLHPGLQTKPASATGTVHLQVMLSQSGCVWVKTQELSHCCANHGSQACVGPRGQEYS